MRAGGKEPATRSPALPRRGLVVSKTNMSPSRTFILRPVATSLLMVGILLAGFVAYLQLPWCRRCRKEVDYPIIQIMTFYPGASPDVMASSVTAPLERQFGQVPGLQQMTSVSSDGSSVITLQFNLSLNIDIAEQEVQQSINASGTYLPADLPVPPVYTKTNPADAPILTLALTSKEIPLSQVEDLADTRLAPKVSQLPGVGLVSISGGQKPAVRIRANPSQLASYGINLEDVRTALAAANVNQAKGNFDGPHQSYQIGATDQLLSSADYAGLVIALQERRADPAHRRGYRRRQRGESAAGGVDERGSGGDREHSAAARRQHRSCGGGSNSEAASLQLTQHLAGIGQGQHPDGFDDHFIRASVKDVEFSLGLTIFLVVMVIFLFLRSVSATIIPSVAVPLSLVGTFGVMYMLGYSLDNLSLMALTISKGFVVDDVQS